MLHTAIHDIYMLILKWEQTPYGYGESPNAVFFVTLPVTIRGLPIWLRGLCFLELYTDSVFSVGIRSVFLSIYHTDTEGKFGQYISVSKRGQRPPFSSKGGQWPPF